jgi:hypothetical protein
MEPVLEGGEIVRVVGHLVRMRLCGRYFKYVIV